MAYSALPTWPLILFGILEPAALVWGWEVAFFEPAQYYADQVPGAEISKLVFTPQALSLVLQLGNVLLLLAAMAIICCWTTHADITKKYLFTVALADLGHIYAAYRGLGEEIFWDLAQWNDMAYGNIGVSAFLHLNRWLALAGVFGKIHSEVANTKKSN